MKPKIGKKVYLIYDYTILKQKALFVGDKSFIADTFLQDTVKDCWEWNYADYNKTWFTSFVKAKEKLLKDCEKYEKDKAKLVKITDDYYEIEWRKKL